MPHEASSCSAIDRADGDVLGWSIDKIGLQAFHWSANCATCLWCFASEQKAIKGMSINAIEDNISRKQQQGAVS